jgi:hypothetical protein
MRSLSAKDIVNIWEWGMSQHSLQRSLTLLSGACPNLTIEQLARLTIGQRDEYLWRLRELTFGSRLDGFDRCPYCSDRVEFSLEVGDVCVAPPAGVIQPTYTFCQGGIEIEFRLPNSLDLAAIAIYDDPSVAKDLLVQSCVLAARQDGKILTVAELPEDTIAVLATQMAEIDPQAETVLDLTCPGCDRQWQTLLDIATFFWSEITALAKRLLREVHTLAGAYGWRESEILEMSHQRRRCYLEMVGI